MLPVLQPVLNNSSLIEVSVISITAIGSYTILFLCYIYFYSVFIFDKIGFLISGDIGRIEFFIQGDSKGFKQFGEIGICI